MAIRKQAHSPALASMIRSRRVQFLPVQWRASMGFSLDSSSSPTSPTSKYKNPYTLNDITPKGSISYIRELTNSVLTDIPLFMSHHRERMIESVCIEANGVYEKWIRRHRGWRDGEGGRVHVIAHSLGSALVAHILSNQPTRIERPLVVKKDEDEEGRKRRMRQGFGFDVW